MIILINNFMIFLKVQVWNCSLINKSLAKIINSIHNCYVVADRNLVVRGRAPVSRKFALVNIVLAVLCCVNRTSILFFKMHFWNGLYDFIGGSFFVKSKYFLKRFCFNTLFVFQKFPQAFLLWETFWKPWIFVFPDW